MQAVQAYVSCILSARPASYWAARVCRLCCQHSLHACKSLHLRPRSLSLHCLLFGKQHALVIITRVYNASCTLSSIKQTASAVPLPL